MLTDRLPFTGCLAAVCWDRVIQGKAENEGKRFPLFLVFYLLFLLLLLHKNGNCVTMKNKSPIWESKPEYEKIYVSVAGYDGFVHGGKLWPKCRDG
jgi:hypothetical protein